jgi:hypothetical protein
MLGWVRRELTMKHANNLETTAESTILTLP